MLSNDQFIDLKKIQELVKYDFETNYPKLRLSVAVAARDKYDELVDAYITFLIIKTFGSDKYKQSENNVENIRHVLNSFSIVYSFHVTDYIKQVLAQVLIKQIRKSLL